MPKKKQHGAILAIDPSYRGLGVAFYNAHYSYYFTKCYDICQDYKRFSTYTVVIKLVGDFLDELFETLDPFIWDTTVLVIESQYKKAMERLQDAIVNQLYCRLEGKIKTIPVAAYTWREYYSLSGPKYNQRKKLSVEFVNSNPQLICWLPGLKDDNICEAIILLNFAIKKHSLALIDPMDYDNDQSHNCPTCGSSCTSRVSGDNAKHPGREYWCCTNPSCPKKGFVCFVGEENKAPSYLTKRSYQRKQSAMSKVKVQDAPPAKRPYTPAATVAPPSTQRPSTPEDNTPWLLGLIKKDLQEFHDDLLSELATTNKFLSVLCNNYGASYSTDYPEKRGISDFYTEETLSQHDNK